jgi:hypothetical protein
VSESLSLTHTHTHTRTRTRARARIIYCTYKKKVKQSHYMPWRH